MEIICENCRAKLNIPDEKIPKNQRVSIKCPKCRNKVVVGASKGGAPDTRANITATDEWPAGMEALGADEDMQGEALEFYGDDEKLGLVLVRDPQIRNAINEALDGLGYRSLMEENAKQALKKMRLHACDVVFLSDGFDDVPLEKSPVMMYINRLSMSIRRRMFLALIGERFKTLDRLTAFAMSANLVVNEKDANSLNRILGKAISDNEKFYKVFTDTLKEVGKA